MLTLFNLFTNPVLMTTELGFRHDLITPIAFAAMLVIALGYFAYSVYIRFSYLAATKFEKRWDNLGKRIVALLKYVAAQYRLFKEPLPGFMHFFIFWTFMTLLIAKIIWAGQAFVPDFNLWILHPHNDILGAIYYSFKDIIVFICLLAILYAFYRRLISRPDRMHYSWEANLILGFILIILLTEYTYEAATFIMEETANTAYHPFVPFTDAVKSLYAAIGIADNTTALNWIAGISYWLHFATIFVFLNFLPVGKHFHVVTSIPNVFLMDLSPRGRLRNDIDIEDETAETFGVSRMSDYSWKVFFDAYTCTECGRCRDNCPAYNTGKKLDPMEVNVILRKYMMDHGKEYLEWKKKREEVMKTVKEEEREAALLEIPEPPTLLTEEYMDDEIFWSCTTCFHCEESCPVLIEHVHKLIDCRRYRVLMESNNPEELNATMRGFENQSNPWGVGPDQRADWIKPELNIPIMAEKGEAEYLLYLGCSAAFDSRNQKIATAFVELLNKAGVDYAYLGVEELCCGETARRIGNEYLAILMIQALIEVFNQYNVKKIITICPHGYNTFKNEYPDFGFKAEVYHHTEFLEKLIKEGKLKPSKDYNKNIVYHDSCYIGRYHGLYEEPRNIIKSIPGTKLTEIEKSKKLGFCCGAGGGRMWVDEPADQRVNTMRFGQILEGNPECIVTACPYCMTMIDDACKDAEKEEMIKILDVAELLRNSVE